MLNKFSPQYQSFHGLNTILVEAIELRRFIHEIILKNISVENSEFKQRSSIKILDTFMSDTLQMEDLKEILMYSKIGKGSVPIKILMLDPFSSYAKSRGKLIKQNPIKETNTALNNILLALLKNLSKRSDVENCYQSYLAGIHKPILIQEQLNKIHTLIEGNYDLNIKFYDLLTDVPVYIFLEYAAKGLLTTDTTADSPWLIFVDHSQSGDVYDFLHENFEYIWKYKSYDIPSDISSLKSVSSSTDNNIFFGHGSSNIVNDVLSYFNWNYEQFVTRYCMNLELNRFHPENIEEKTSNCSRAVIIISKNDGEFDDNIDNSQNIFLKIGYCQCKFGIENTILFREEGTKQVAEEIGIGEIIFTPQEINKALAQLEEWIELTK